MWEAITQGTTCVKMGWSDAYTAIVNEALIERAKQGVKKKTVALKEKEDPMLEIKEKARNVRIKFGERTNQKL